MAYYGYEFYYDGVRATFWGYVQTALVNMGWELHDNISATVKVYKSNGESGNEPYGYIWMDAGTSAYIQCRGFQYWNATTHVGTRPRYAGDSAGYARFNAPGAPAVGMIAGNKDIVLIHTHGANYGQLFGHLPIRFDNNFTMAMGTAGTAGTITIASSAGMGIGKRIQICGNTGEGCDSLIITGAPSSTTRLVSALPRNYGTSSVVGAPASTFGCGYVGAAMWYPVSLWGDSGTAGTATGYLTVASYSQPISVMMYNEGKYYLTPFFAYLNAATTPGQFMGCFGNDFPAGLNPSVFDAMILNEDGSFPPTNNLTGVTDNTISDNSRSWTTNAHAGKFCVITGGQGVGAVKKILSNTSDTLTLDSNWYMSVVSPTVPMFPSGGTEFKIIDTVYRGVVQLWQTYGYAKLTDTIVPV